MSKVLHKSHNLRMVALMRAKVLTKVCVVPRCGRAVYPGLTVCSKHQIARAVRGLAWAEPDVLPFAKRRPYIRVLRTHLTERLRLGTDLSVYTAVRDLASFIRVQCMAEGLQPSDLGRRGLTGVCKVRAILGILARQFGSPEAAALAVLSVACGVTLAAKVESKVQHPLITRACITSSIWLLVSTRPQRFGAHVYRRHRPQIKGPRLQAAVEKLIVKPFVSFLLTAETEQELLSQMLQPDAAVYGFPGYLWKRWYRRLNKSIHTIMNKGAYHHVR